jgi:hypothetical protein
MTFHKGKEGIQSKLQKQEEVEREEKYISSCAKVKLTNK